jgi:hypothetical protein
MWAAPKLGCLVALAVCLAVTGLPEPDSAEARTLTAVSKKGKRLRGPYQRWIDRAKVPTVGGRVRIVLSGCPGRPRFAGCVYTRRLRTIYIKRSVADLKGTLYHELGHLFDFRLMSRGERRLYKRLTGQRKRAWFGGVNPPGEQFAEAYALCASRRRLARVARGHYGFRTSPRRHRAVCGLIRRAAGPKGRPRPPKAPPVVVEPPATAKPPPKPPANEPPQEEDETLLEKLLPW